MNQPSKSLLPQRSGLSVVVVVCASVLGLAAIGGPLAWSFVNGSAGMHDDREAKQSADDVVDSVGDDPANALQNTAPEQQLAQASTQAPSTPEASGPNWRLRCSDTNDASTCSMNQELFLQQTVDGQLQTVGRLLNLTVVYLDAGGERVPFMSLQMPLGVDLRPGAVMRVDEEGETTLEFLRCTEAGCDSSARITPQLLAQMRAGNVLRVGFRPWGSEQVTAVEASLAGFTAAFAQLR